LKNKIQDLGTTGSSSWRRRDVGCSMARVHIKYTVRFIVYSYRTGTYGRDVPLRADGRALIVGGVLPHALLEQVLR